MAKFSPPVQILRERGIPMSLRDIAKATAQRLDFSVAYLDIDSALEIAKNVGQVIITCDSNDFRDRIWMATDG